MKRILPDANPQSPRFPSALLRRSILALVAILIIAFYAWDAVPSRSLFGRFDGDNCYYNFLVNGFRSGHLSFAVQPSPELLKAKDPYDPATATRFGIPDVSYYKGKYYLYFGVAPALVLYWPFAAVSGKYLTDSQAVFLFCSAGFMIGSLLLIRVRQRYFPGLGVMSDCGALIAMGLAAMVPVLLRRPLVYEAAISSAYAFFILSLLGLYQSLHSRRKLAWLAIASLSYGLAIASRPTYLFGAACLLIPVWLGSRPDEAGTDNAGPARLARACAAIVPVGLIVMGLMAYNELRFDNPFEFGQRLTLSGVREVGRTHFSLSYFGFNCRAYLFASAHLSSYFPFVRVVSLPAASAGYLGGEDPYGIFPNIPFVALAFLTPFACMHRRVLGTFVLCVAIAVAAVAAVVFSFDFASNRYMIDFLPGLMILAVIGSWGFVDCLKGGAGTLAGAACAFLLCWSVLFNVLAAFGHNDLLRLNDPASFHRLAHAFGYPRFYYDKLTGRKYGPLELTVRFPKFEKSKLEPLVITGSEFLSDYIYMLYLPDNRMIMGSEHTGHGGPVTKGFSTLYDRTHRIVVDMPSLYPPREDPYFDRLPSARVDAFNNRLRVWLDDAEIINAPQQFYPPFSTTASIGGGTESQRALGRRFTGQILGIRRLEPDFGIPAETNRVGSLVIALQFPEGKTSGHEPIVTSGVPGKGDVLVVNYIDSSHATFSLDHWGSGGPVSAPVEFIPGDLQILEVRFGSFFPASRRPTIVPEPLWTEASEKLVLILNHRRVLEMKTPFYEGAPDTVVVGKNSIGASSCVPEFTGMIAGYRRSDLNTGD